MELGMLMLVMQKRRPTRSMVMSLGAYPKTLRPRLSHYGQTHLISSEKPRTFCHDMVLSLVSCW